MDRTRTDILEMTNWLRENRLTDVADLFVTQILGEHRADVGVHAEALVAIAGNHASIDTLHAALESIDTNSVGWWRWVAEGWLEAEVPLLTRMCADYTRGMIEDHEAEWSDIATLASLASVATVKIESRLLQQSGVGSRRKRDSDKEKRDRLNLIFGRGETAKVEVLRKRSWDNDDILAYLLYSTAQTNNQFPYYDWFFDATWWFYRGETRLAFDLFKVGLQQNINTRDKLVEGLFGHMTGLFAYNDRMKNTIGAFEAAARHLDEIGDPISAFACCYLVRTLYPDPSEAEHQNTTNDFIREQYAQIIEMAQRLQEAEGFLASSAGTVPALLQRDPISSWFADHNLAGRYISFLRNSGDYTSNFSMDTINHRICSIAQQQAWPILPSMGALKSRESNNRRNAPETEASFAPPPGLLYVQELASDAALTSVTSLPQPPGEIDGRGSYPLNVAFPVPIGYTPPPGSSKRGLLHESIGVGSDTPLFALGASAQQVLSTIAHHCEDRIVLWIHRDEGDTAPVLLGRAVQKWLRIVPGNGNQRSEHGRQWLLSMERVPEIHRAIRHALSTLLSPCGGTDSDKLLDTLLSSGLGESHLGQIFENQPHLLRQEAVRFIGRKTQTDVCTPLGLRHFISQMKLIIEAVDALHDALRLETIGSDEEAQCTGVEIVLPTDSPATGVITALLAAGSLFETIAKLRKVDLETRREAGEDDFDLGPIRKVTEDGEELIEEEEEEEEPESQTDLEDNMWVASRLVSQTRTPQVILMLCNLWGPEWSPLREWFRPGELADHHCLVVGSSNPSASMISRDNLKGVANFVIGPLKPETHQAFQIATQTLLPAPYPEHPQDAIHLQVLENEVLAKRLIVWPDVDR